MPAFSHLLASLTLIGPAVLAYPGLLNHPVPRDTSAQNLFNQAVETQIQTSELPAEKVTYTRVNGQPYPQPYEAQRVGDKGPLLLQDLHLLELFQHFDRERIPERVVHARGAGAHGTFTLTSDWAKQYTMMEPLQEVGSKTSVTMRFSTVGGESGSADSARDPRGFAIKMRTKGGILDWVFNNTPVFFIRDPAKFPHFIHTQKRNPQTHLKDPDMFWDYMSLNPESLFQFLRLFSDLGTPQGFRHMNGWSGHTYKWLKKSGEWVYVKIYCETQQGIANFTGAEATAMAGTNPDFATKDLFESIASGDYPKWKVYGQVLTPKQAETFRYNVFDLTKDWPAELVPRHEIGIIELNTNPSNYFAEIEQASFAPSNMVDGWGPSEDPVLQMRLFSYADTAHHRLGPNHYQIPVNCPFNPTANFQRDAVGQVTGNQGSRYAYISSLQSINLPERVADDSNHTNWVGGAVRYLSQITDIDFEQPTNFYGNLTQQDKDHLVSNVVGHLGNAKSKAVKQRTAGVFGRANEDLGKRIAAGVNVPYVPYGSS